MLVKWPKVHQFHNVRKSIKERKRYHQVEGLDPYEPPIVHYRGKIKLDGTNAAITTNKGEFMCQSRTKLITPEDDNMGFARWVDESGFGKHLAGRVHQGAMTYFGEWCGQGIQKRCAISKIDKKVFVVFAALAHNNGRPNTERPYKEFLFVCPESVGSLLGYHGREDVFVLPWHDAISIDFADTTSVEGAIEDLNNRIEVVEKCDPWVRETFGIEGLGEGIVYYPRISEGRDLTPGNSTAEAMGSWGFKAKGDKHQVVRQKKSILADPEKVADVEAFVAKFVTDNRMEQGLNEACGGSAEPNQTGNFLRWFGQDVKGESKDELEVSNLEWKDVSKAVSTAAREWFLDKCKRV